MLAPGDGLANRLKLRPMHFDPKTMLAPGFEVGEFMQDEWQQLLPPDEVRAIEI